MWGRKTNIMLQVLQLLELRTIKNVPEVYSAKGCLHIVEGFVGGWAEEEERERERWTCCLLLNEMISIWKLWFDSLCQVSTTSLLVNVSNQWNRTIYAGLQARAINSDSSDDGQSFSFWSTMQRFDAKYRSIFAYLVGRVYPFAEVETMKVSVRTINWLLRKVGGALESLENFCEKSKDNRESLLREGVQEIMFQVRRKSLSIYFYHDRFQLSDQFSVHGIETFWFSLF